MPTQPIWFRSNGPEEYRFLSNFYPCELKLLVKRYGPIVAPSLEHAYQALKAATDAEFYHVLSAPSADEARRRGRRVTLREGFEPRETMRKLLRVKFRRYYGSGKLNPLGLALVDTGDAQLIEDNRGPWGGHDGGANWLGTMLMERREELR